MGKPDGRRAEDYDRLDNLTKSQWAWEFLRRNPDYIKAWERYCDAVIEVAKTRHSNAYELCGAHVWGIDGDYIDPENDNPGIKWMPFYDGGVTYLTCPRTKKGHGTKIIGCEDFTTGNVPIGFNFLKPIKPQIENAKKTLDRLRDEAEKRGTKAEEAYKLHGMKDGKYLGKWKFFLRILDMTREGIKDKEIATILFNIKPCKANRARQGTVEWAEASAAKKSWHNKVDRSV